MTNTPRNLRVGTAALAVFLLAGCTQYVKKDEFNASIQQLQGQVSALQQDLDAFKQSTAAQFSALDAKVVAMEGKVAVDNVAHFDFNAATLREQDKPALAAFAKTVAERHSAAIVTVEGFADPAGSRAYNKRLGQQRADAVRDFLVANGMSAGQVRAVSYGDTRNRQVDQGATGASGERNRRAAVVVDFAG